MCVCVCLCMHACVWVFSQCAETWRLTCCQLGLSYKQRESRRCWHFGSRGKLLFHLHLKGHCGGFWSTVCTVCLCACVCVYLPLCLPKAMCLMCVGLCHQFCVQKAEESYKQRCWKCWAWHYRIVGKYPTPPLSLTDTHTYTFVRVYVYKIST